MKITHVATRVLRTRAVAAKIEEIHSVMLEQLHLSAQNVAGRRDRLG